MRSNNSTSDTVPISSSCFTKTLLSSWWCEDPWSDPGHIRARLMWLDILACQGSGGRLSMGTARTLLSLRTSATRRRRGATLQSNCWASGKTEKNDANIIAGDFDTSDFREREKAKMSPIEDKWEETILIPPPNVVPGWGRRQNSLRLHFNCKECAGLEGTKGSKGPGKRACFVSTSSFCFSS